MNDSTNSSPRQLTLKFTGVEDETTSEEIEEENTHFPSHTSESVLFTSNGNLDHLTVDSIIGKIVVVKYDPLSFE